MGGSARVFWLLSLEATIIPRKCLKSVGRRCLGTCPSGGDQGRGKAGSSHSTAEAELLANWAHKLGHQTFGRPRLDEAVGNARDSLQVVLWNGESPNVTLPSDCWMERAVHSSLQALFFLGGGRILR